MRPSKGSSTFNKQYSIAIDTVPLPENPLERTAVLMKQVNPLINEILTDVMSVAIGSWPTPEKPKQHQLKIER